ncbi:transmembrane protein 234 homolog [Physella acuta]|uniref:transmembrane protein 234 homolog n=1 Tax=Physella acuta TaxID=109671 RepID=UPI0027DB1C5A|nr:transmembrane protein 234 homolog [Physella acuta]
MKHLGDAFWLLIVATLWGATNPLIKRHSKGVEDIKRTGRVSQFVAEIAFLFLNWKYLLSFLCNQLGSVVYYVTLASADLTLAVPVTNSLTLITTAMSARMLGDQRLTYKTFVGMFLVATGVTLCVLSKVKQEDS